MEATEKRCSKCGEIKALGGFLLRNGKPLNHCKTCRNNAAKEWHKANPEKVRAARRAWRIRNPEKTMAENRIRSAQLREQYKDNPEIFLARGRKHREDRSEEVKQKEIAQMKEWREKNSGYCKQFQRARHLRLSYGLTVQEYDSKLASQSGKCAACGDLPSGDIGLFVDHDHQTGAIRGLLCRFCNSALGMLKDDVDCILSLAGYLRQHKPDARNRENGA